MISHTGPFGASRPISRVLSFKTAIYLDAPLPTRSSRLPGTVGPTCMSLHGVAPDRVYSIPMSPWDGCALTAPFHSYLPKGRRHISVALVLRSPSAGVTRYPCPAEPGLSSYSTFRRLHAAVQPGCPPILSYQRTNVKCLAKSFSRGYTKDR